MTAPIKTRPLGRTGLEVTEVALGGLFVAKEMGTDREDGIQVIHRALEQGVNYIDTAPLYGNSQEVLGEALAGREKTYTLGSKCGRWDWDTGPYRELDAFKRQFEQTLTDLRCASVDILYIHESDWLGYWKDQDLPRTRCHIDLNETYAYSEAPAAQFLLWAQEQGLTTYLGISGNNAHLLAKVLREIDLPIDVLLVAIQYDLIGRNAPKFLLPPAKELGVGVVLGAPLHQGRLSYTDRAWIEDPPDWMNEDLHARYTELYAIQEAAGMSLAQLGLRFLLADPDFSTVIPGAATAVQQDENVQASEAGPLPPDIHARIKALGKVYEGIHAIDYS